MNAAPRIVTIGETFHSTLELSVDSVKSFASLVNDFNPLHHDEAYAAQSRFGGLIASGTQPTAHFMALLATHFSTYAQPLGLEFDTRRGEIRLRNPRLPAFLNEVILRELKLGSSSVDLCVRRHGDDVSLEVLRTRGQIQVSIVLTH